MNRHVVAALACIIPILFPNWVLAENPTSSAYKIDDSGNVVRDRNGNCVRTKHWTKEAATVVGCDGYHIDTSEIFTPGQPIKGGIVTLDIPYEQNFTVDSGTLSDAGKAVVDRTTTELLENMSSAYRIVISGYTDTSGAEDYNFRLSKMRAQSVADYLIQTKGIDPKRIRVLGMGPSQPIADNSTKAGREANRRAEIVVVGRLKEMDKMVFPSATLFERRSADLTAAGNAMLMENAQKAVDRFKNATLIEITGHTDNVGGAEYNIDLSQARAENVAKHLIDLGVNPEKIIKIGAGQNYPIASNATEEGRQANRRVEILVVGLQR